MAADVNAVTLVGRLTSDPELRSTAGGTAVCNMRIAVHTRKKNDSGEWADVPNYISVTTFGWAAENAAKYLEKGKRIGVHGSFQWREWTNKKTGEKQQTIEVVAEMVQYLDPMSDSARVTADEARKDPGDDVPF